MKKIILVCFIIFNCLSVKAIHYFGSEITCKQLNGLTYHLTYKFYGDLNGFWNYDNQITLRVTDNSTGSYFYINAIRTNDKHIYDVIYQIDYSALLTFPSPGTYIISQGTCCWNFSTNVPNSIGQTYHNQCLITVDTIAGNSSPEFLYDPIVLAAVNDTLYYNPLPYDEDGDDLVWSIDTPRTNINGVLYGYTTPAGSSGLNFSINPKTGEITWKPNEIGQFITSVRVEEFRNGIKIGEVVRDMIFIVKSIQGNSSRANIDTDTWNVDPLGNFVFYLNYNQPFNLLVIASDANNDFLSVEAKGVPFLLKNNPASFLSTTGAGYSVNGFSWTPTYSDIKIDPYLVVLRIYETTNIDTLLRDRTIQLRVGIFSSTQENDNLVSIGNIYPVPSTGSLYFPVTDKKDSDLKLSFVNQLGQEVKSFDRKLNAGQNILYFSDLNLPAGIYFINTNIDGNEQVRKLVIE